MTKENKYPVTKTVAAIAGSLILMAIAVPFFLFVCFILWLILFH